MHTSFASSRMPAPQFQPAATMRESTPAINRYADQPEERLPFSVRLVSCMDDLLKAVHIRQAAYARHLPEFAKALGLPEAADYEEGTVILLAESHLDGSPLGTMRVQTNRFKPLTLEQSIDLPGWMQNQSLAEATRLGVTNDKVGRLVTTVLFKAFFQYCQFAGIDWMVITARSPVDRQYQRLLFSDVYPDRGYIPMRHVNGLPHRVMSFEVDAAEALWHAARHPLFDFIFRTQHPDIQVQPHGRPSVFFPIQGLQAGQACEMDAGLQTAAFA